MIDIDGTTASPILESLIGKSLACKNIFIDTLVVQVTGGFLNDVSVTLIDKTDGSDPKKPEDYWMKTLKTMVPYGLNIEDSV